MANVSKVNLTNKDIRNLEIKENMYIKCIGNPSTLYIKKIYPSVVKTFFLRLSDKQKNYKIKKILIE